MATRRPSPVTYTASGALEPFRLVKIVAGSTTTPPEVEYCSGVAGEDRGIRGVTLPQVGGIADGDIVAVETLDDGVHKVTAVDTDIAIGDELFTAADGKVTDTTTSETRVGSADMASTADGDIIEMFADLQSYDAVDASS